MSKYDNLNNKFSKAPAEDKLKILRHEMLQPIGTIRGYVKLLGEIKTDNIKGLPKDFEIYVKNLVAASDDLLKILEALTD